MLEIIFLKRLISFPFPHGEVISERHWPVLNSVHAVLSLGLSDFPVYFLNVKQNILINYTHMWMKAQHFKIFLDTQKALLACDLTGSSLL